MSEYFASCVLFSSVVFTAKSGSNLLTQMERENALQSPEEAKTLADYAGGVY